MYTELCDIMYICVEVNVFKLWVVDRFNRSSVSTSLCSVVDYVMLW